MVYSLLSSRQTDHRHRLAADFLRKSHDLPSTLLRSCSNFKRSRMQKTQIGQRKSDWHHSTSIFLPLALIKEPKRCLPMSSITTSSHSMPMHEQPRENIINWTRCVVFVQASRGITRKNVADNRFEKSNICFSNISKEIIKAGRGITEHHPEIELNWIGR